LASASRICRNNTAAYCQRWEEETGNDQLKTCLRGPGKVLRSKSPDMPRQEIYGYLLTHYAISALICRAPTDPDRVKFLRTVRIIRRRAAGPAFPTTPSQTRSANRPGEAATPVLCATSHDHLAAGPSRRASRIKIKLGQVALTLDTTAAAHKGWQL